MLDSFFADCLIKRDDAVDPVHNFKKVLKNRIDAIVINEQSGLKTIKLFASEFEGKFYMSKNNVGTAEVRLAMNKEWKEFLEFFNKELECKRQSGELQKIIDKYITHFK